MKWEVKKVGDQLLNQLDNLEQTIYYDSDARKCTAELSGIFFREIEEEDNITLNKK